MLLQWGIDNIPRVLIASNHSLSKGIFKAGEVPFIGVQVRRQPQAIAALADVDPVCDQLRGQFSPIDVRQPGALEMRRAREWVHRFEAVFVQDVGNELVPLTEFDGNVVDAPIVEQFERRDGTRDIGNSPCSYCLKS